jgi:ubiquitin C-terminal hydrolase
VEHFYGQQCVQIRCDVCGAVSDRYEPWSSLKLPIPGGDKAGADAPNMSDCLDAAHETEQLDDYACETCKERRPAKISRSISRLPNILIATFKRFTNTGAKIRGLIDWDTEALDLTPWMTFKRHCPFRSERQQALYRTFAVIEHHGSSRGGHYRMYGRGACDGAGAGAWIAYDDDGVQGGLSRSQVVSPDSYILFLMPVASCEPMLKRAASTLAGLKCPSPQ